MLTPIRFSPLGQWYRADDGRGALLVAPDLVADDESRQRLVDAVVRVRQIHEAELLDIADVVADEGRVWVLAAGPAEPCLSEVMSRTDDGLDLVGARTVLRDVGNGLAALHAIGLGHGGVSPQTIVLTTAGVAVLTEAALAAPLLGQPVELAADARGWAATATTLAAQWGRGDGPGARTLMAAAATADRSGFAAALDVLPVDDGQSVERARAALARHAVVEVAGAVPATPEIAAAPEVVEAQAAILGVAAVPVGAATMLGARRPAPAAVPVGSDTVLGARHSGPAVVGESAGGVRFGPGVPAAASTAPPAVLAVADVLARRDDDARRRRRRTTRRRWLGTLIVLAAVAGYLLWRSSWTVSVHRAQVTATVRHTGTCQARIDFTGRITVGGVGQIRYQWLRSDGTRSATEHANVAPGQKHVTVHLLWSFSGPGHYDATARLHVWGSHEVTAQGSAAYDC